MFRDVLSGFEGAFLSAYSPALPLDLQVRFSFHHHHTQWMKRR